MLPNENAYTNSFVVNVTVTCRHLALELLGVLVPELRSLCVQRRVTGRSSQQACLGFHCAVEPPLASQVELLTPSHLSQQKPEI